MAARARRYRLGQAWQSLDDAMVHTLRRHNISGAQYAVLSVLGG